MRDSESSTVQGSREKLPVFSRSGALSCFDPIAPCVSTVAGLAAAVRVVVTSEAPRTGAGLTILSLSALEAMHAILALRLWLHAPHDSPAQHDLPAMRCVQRLLVRVAIDNRDRIARAAIGTLWVLATERRIANDVTGFGCCRFLFLPGQIS